MKMTFHPYSIPFKHSFKITHGTREIQETLIVALHEGNYTGFGEAPAIPYYNVKIDQMIKDLEKCQKVVEEFELVDVDVFWSVLSEKLRKNSFALCALDIAAHDLWGKLNHQPLYKLWNLERDHLPLTNYTIGIDSIDNMISKIQELPWPLYKIKLGTSDDIKIIKELRKHTNAIFRVDANGAWTVEETINNATALKKLNVEFIEQPLKATDYEGMKEVFKYAVLPIIADESCVKETDVEKCHNLFHGINIKLTKCGGLTPARRMIAEAKRLGMTVMMGCMTETTVGISAIAQLLPLVDYVDMDGPLLLKEDIATGVKIEEGKIIFADENGTGATLFGFQ